MPFGWPVVPPVCRMAQMSSGCAWLAKGSSGWAALSASRSSPVSLGPSTSTDLTGTDSVMSAARSVIRGSTTSARLSTSRTIAACTSAASLLYRWLTRAPIRLAAYRTARASGILPLSRVTVWPRSMPWACMAHAIRCTRVRNSPAVTRCSPYTSASRSGFSRRASRMCSTWLRKRGATSDMCDPPEPERRGARTDLMVVQLWGVDRRRAPHGLGRVGVTPRGMAAHP